MSVMKAYHTAVNIVEILIVKMAAMSVTVKLDMS